jgi:Cdc6-like AAA superfamily ATPase
MGKGLSSHREAKEITPTTSEYTKVIASIFDQAYHAGGNFCFALFGGWGRGKTTLMKKVKEDLPNYFKVIEFSAWHYRKTPEIWAYLYETVRTGIDTNDGWAARFRSGISKCGYWPLIVFFVSLLLILFPLPIPVENGEKTKNVLNIISPLIGLIGVIFSGRPYVTTKESIDFLKQNYLSHAIHGDKLGLKGVIGDDLKHLLIGYSPGDYFGSDKAPRRLWPALNAIIIWFMLWLSLFVFDYGKYARISITPLLALGVMVVAAILLSFPFILTRKQSANRPVLLVIDDLDRIPHDEIMNVLESLVTILEDPDVKQRLLVAILVEERNLRIAIAEKYKAMIFIDRKDDVSKGSIVDDSDLQHPLVRENLEKFFLCSLRLGNIPDKEIKEYIELIIGKDAYSEILIDGAVTTGWVSGVADDGGDDMGDDGGDDIITGGIDDSIGTDADIYGEMAGKRIDAELSKNEENILREAIEDLIRITKDENNNIPKMTPRSIKSFRYRYQLARNILDPQEGKSDESIKSGSVRIRQIVELLKYYWLFGVDKKPDSKEYQKNISKIIREHDKLEKKYKRSKNNDEKYVYYKVKYVCKQVM